MDIKKTLASIAVAGALQFGLSNNAYSGTMLYDDFSSDSLDSGKWEVSSNLDESFIDNGAYHTAQLTSTDKYSLLEFKDKIFYPGDFVEYDVNYVSGDGNRQTRIQINDERQSLFGFWNTVRDAGVGNDLGNYHVVIRFLDAGVEADITNPFGETINWPQIFGDGPVGGPASEYTFGVVTSTGHNGNVHLDYDNFYITSPSIPEVPEPSTLELIILGTGILGTASYIINKNKS